MDLKDVEKYWIYASSDAYNTATILFKKKKYKDSMFYLHLSLEKMLKGLYVNYMDEEAPWGHNLQSIGMKISGLNLPEDKKILLGQITAFNIKARYDDYKESFNKLCDKKFAKNYLKSGKELLSWLKSQLR